MNKYVKKIKAIQRSPEARVMFGSVLLISAMFATIIFGLTVVFAHQDRLREQEATHELIQNFAQTIGPLLVRYDLSAIDRALEVMSLRDDIFKVSVLDRYDVIVSSNELEKSSQRGVTETYIAKFDGRKVGQVVVNHLKPSTFGDVANLFYAALLSFIICFGMGWLILRQYVQKFVKIPLIELQAACEETLTTGVHQIAKLNDHGRFGEYANSFNDMQDRLSVLARQQQELLSQTSHEKRLFDEFLKKGEYAILVFDSRGDIIMERGRRIYEIYPLIEKTSCQNIELLTCELKKHAFEVSLGQNSERTFQIDVKGKEGEMRNLLFSFSRFSSDLTAVNAYDATCLKKHENAIAELQRVEALVQITSGVAHDFNNILASIQFNISAFECARNERITVSEREMVENAEQSVKMGAELTRQLLAYSGKQVLNNENVQLKDSIEEAVSFLSRAIGTMHNVKIYPDFTATVKVDPVMLKRCLVNLGLNAKNALPDGGEIVIGQRLVQMHDREFALIDVFNKSAPLPRRIISRAFDPFFTTRPNAGGSGLGLSVVQGFAEQSGGFARLENVKNGVRATIGFPAIKGNANALKRSNSLPKRESIVSNRQANILLVDDNVAVLNGLSQLLKALGNNTLDFNGFLPSDLARIDLNNIDLVISDFMMPEFDGVEVAQMLRGAGFEKPIFLLTGLELTKVSESVGKLGNTYVLAKPIDKSTLIRIVDFALSRSEEKEFTKLKAHV